MQHIGKVIAAKQRRQTRNSVILTASKYFVATAFVVFFTYTAMAQFCATDGLLGCNNISGNREGEIVNLHRDGTSSYVRRDNQLDLT